MNILQFQALTTLPAGHHFATELVATILFFVIAGRGPLKEHRSLSHPNHELGNVFA
jgi:hypothetical protein